MIVLFQESALKNILFSDKENPTGFLEGSASLEDIVNERVPKEQRQRIEQACFRLLKQIHDGLRVVPQEKPIQRLVWTYQKMKKLSESSPEISVDWNASWTSLYTKLSLQSFRQKLCKDIEIWCGDKAQIEKMEEVKRQIIDLFDHYEESRGSLCRQITQVMEACLPILDPDQSQEVSASQLVYSYAVSSHYARGVGEFIAHSRDVNEQDSLQRTLLHWAAEEGDWEIAAALLLAKADIHAQDEKGNTPLHLAAIYAPKEVMELFLHVEDVHLDLPNLMGDTALHLAVRCKRLDLASQLMNKKASPNLQNQQGYSPLHLAAEKGNLEMVRLLLFYGADLRLQTKKGLTPLHIAAARGFEEIVDALIQAGADVNLQALDGSSPLHLASYNGRVDVIRLLLAVPDIDTTLVGRIGQTPMNLSFLSGSAAAAWELFTLENYTAEVLKPFIPLVTQSRPIADS